MPPVMRSLVPISSARGSVREGDIVLMQQADHAQSGQIVAATVQDMDCMATLKYFVTGKRPMLCAANPSYPDQEFTGRPDHAQRYPEGKAGTDRC